MEKESYSVISGSICYCKGLYRTTVEDVFPYTCLIWDLGESPSNREFNEDDDSSNLRFVSYQTFIVNLSLPQMSLWIFRRRPLRLLSQCTQILRLLENTMVLDKKFRTISGPLITLVLKHLMWLISRWPNFKDYKDSILLHFISLCFESPS